MKYLSRVLSLCFCCLALFGCIQNQAFAASTWDGTGSSSQPYLIYTEEDLRRVAEGVQAGNTYKDLHFSLSDNIALSEEWIPIGTAETYFCGTFDGNGYTISNLKASEVIIWDCLLM